MAKDTSENSKKLKGLRNRAALSTRALGKLVDWVHTRVQYYEDEFKGDLLPQAVVAKLAPHLIGKGSPPITEEEVYALAGMTPPGRPVERRLMPEVIARTDKNTPIPIRGEVAAGRWLDLDVELGPDDFEQIPVSASPAYPFAAQFGLIARGTSLNRVVGDGSVLHCVDLGIAAVEPVEDDIVIVERRRHQQGQKEVTAKRISRKGSIILLSPDSSDPKWKPIKLDTDNPPEDEEVAVVAIVIGVYQPLRARK